jgi:anti-anti-sigma factor
MVQVVRTGEGDATVWQVVGELDLGSAEVLGTAIVPNGEVCLTLDLSELTFIDSSGLHALERLARTERTIMLRGPAANVRRVFEIVGFEQDPRFVIEDL